MRWGFGMKQGPFELWQEAGWLEVAKMIQKTSTLARRCAGTAARVGSRACGRGRWRAHRARFVERIAEKVCPAASCPCTSARSSRGAAGRNQPARLAHRWHHHCRIESPAHLDADEQGSDRQHQEQDARHQPRGDGRSGWKPWSWPSANTTAWSSGRAMRRSAWAPTWKPPCPPLPWAARRSGKHRAGAAEPDDAHPLRPGARGGCHPRHGAGRWLRAGRVFGQARGAHGKLHRPWSKWAWAWCPALAA